MKNNMEQMLFTRLYREGKATQSQIRSWFQHTPKIGGMTYVINGWIKMGLVTRDGDGWIRLSEQMIKEMEKYLDFEMTVKGILEQIKKATTELKEMPMNSRAFRKKSVHLYGLKDQLSALVKATTEHTPVKEDQ